VIWSAAIVPSARRRNASPNSQADKASVVSEDWARHAGLRKRRQSEELAREALSRRYQNMDQRKPNSRRLLCCINKPRHTAMQIWKRKHGKQQKKEQNGKIEVPKDPKG
jgi:hypothetical protein